MHVSDIVPGNMVLGAEWRLITECDAEGYSELASALSELSSNEYNGFLALFIRICSLGPRSLTQANCHEFDNQNGIYEFIKGNFRVAWFYDENKVIVCSHLFRKKSQKTKKAEKEKTIRFKKAYFDAKQSRNMFVVRTAP